MAAPTCLPDGRGGGILMAAVQKLTDRQMLDILDLIDGQGESMARVAERYDVSRSVIAGLLKRVRDDLAMSEAAPGRRARRPENQDGALGRRWWAKTSPGARPNFGQRRAG